MKILFIAPIPYPKSHNIHPAPWVTSLIKRLSNENVYLEVLSISHLCQLKEERFRFEDVNYTFIKTVHPKLDLFGLFRQRIRNLNKWLLSNHHKFDLIHVFGNEHQYELISDKILLPIIVHIQGVISEYRKFYSQHGLKWWIWLLASIYEMEGYRRVNYYSCRTSWDTSIVKKHNSKAEIFNIWEMIREDFFRYEQQNKGTNIVFIGGSNPIKRLEVALEAFNLFKKKAPNSKLLIIGNTNIHILKEIIERNELSLSLNQDVNILGFQNPPGIIKAYQESFCLLHTSIIDNSPNSICEAQVSGLPVISCNVGGISSLIIDGQTGILTDDNPQNIQKCLVDLYDDHMLWDNISAKSRQMAIDRHNPDKIVNSTLDMYKKIIDNNE